MEAPEENIDIRIYGKDACVYCARAKQLLSDAGVPFEYRDVGNSEALRVEMKQKMGVQPTDRVTLPQVFVRGRLVGGFDKLKELHDSGDLFVLIKI